MTDKPVKTAAKPRVRKPKPAPAILTLAQVRAEADGLQAERNQIVSLRNAALAQVQDCDDKLKAYDGALEVCVRFIDRLKAPVES